MSCKNIINQVYPDLAQFGRALHLGCRGRRFKSCNPDQENYNVTALSSSDGAVSISLDILKGRGFESLSDVAL